MTPENKYRVTRGLKVFGLFAWVILTFATCAIVWNSNAGVAPSLLTVALALANCFVVYLIARTFKSPEIEDPHFENPVEAARNKKQA